MNLLSESTYRMGPLTRFLPEFFGEYTFLLDFLDYYDELIADLIARIDQLHYYWDPETAPSEMLDWLGAWVDVELDPLLPERGRRNLLVGALARAGRQGTARGMENLIKTAFCLPEGSVTVIDRPADGKGDPDFHFSIEIKWPDQPIPEAAILRDPTQREQVGRTIVRLVEGEKPAHTFLDKVTIGGPGTQPPETLWPLKPADGPAP